jgi:hypothetical protein
MNWDEYDTTPTKKSLAINYNDIGYFKWKLERETDPINKDCIQQQIDLLEDAIVIYHKHRLAESDELDTLCDLFVQWWYDHHEDSQFFNEAVQQCPTLAKKITITSFLQQVKDEKLKTTGKF